MAVNAIRSQKPHASSHTERMPTPLRAPVSREKSARRVIGLVVSVLLLLVAVWLSLAIGNRPIAFGDVIQGLFAPDAANHAHMIVRELRVPRTLIGLAAGAALAVAGALMQGITRNPLADPGLLGVNAGASVFVVIAIALFGVTSPLGFVWFAFAGSAVAAVLVYAVGSFGRYGATPVKLALAGTAVTAIATSFVTLMLISDAETLGSYRFWQVGSLAGRGLDTLALLWPFVLVGLLLALSMGRTLNLLAFGEDMARGLGNSPIVSRTVSAVAVVLLCGAATALAGPIVFVGLVIPHAVRAITGPDYRWILAYSLVLGPVLLLVADVIGRVVLGTGELEAGLVVAAVGAPVMIAVVRRLKVGGL